MDRYVFAVDDEVFCCWEHDLADRNQRFLSSFDSEYFNYVAQRHLDQLNGENSQRAAVALRAAYHHGLETLFSLLGALAQAPGAVPAWIPKCTNTSLRKLVETIRVGGMVLTQIGPQRVSLHDLAALAHAFCWPEDQPTGVTGDRFGRAWVHFAQDFLDPHVIAEYNSIKHGLRTKNGGFMMSWGLQDAPGQPAPAERMSPLYGSPFGTTYYKRERLDRLNFRARQLTRNWNPQAIVKALNLASVSIHNVVNFARISLGDREDVSCRYPTDEADYSAPWVTNSVVITGGNWDAKLTLADVRPLTEQEIRRRFQPATATPSAPQSPSPSP